MISIEERMKSAANENDFNELVNLVSEHGLDNTEGHGYTILLLSIKNCNRKMTQFLISNGAKLNVENNEIPATLTPLHIAALYDDLETVEILLQYGALINSQIIPNGFTPLHSACDRPCNILTIDILLKHGALINCKTNNGWTPLHIAVLSGMVEVVDLLLKYNADINARTNESFTPLYIAIEHSFSSLAHMLIDRGANLEGEFNNGKTYLSQAIEKDLSTIVKKILTHFPDVDNKINRQSFKTAAKKDNFNPDTIRSLLRYGFSIEPEDINDYKLLHNAIKKGYIEIIEQFLKYGIYLSSAYEDIEELLRIATEATDDYGRTALHIVVSEDSFSSLGHSKNRQFYIADVLLKAGANANAKTSQEETPMHIATKNGYIRIIELLIANKADVNLRNAKGETAVHIAIQENKIDVLRVLLENGAEVDYKDNKEAEKFNDLPTPLQLALNERRADFVKLLLEHKAEFNFLLDGVTPLHYVTMKNRYQSKQMIQLILENSSNVNAKTDDGQTALHFAILSMEPSIVSLLLQYGTDMTAKNNSGQTSLKIALNLKMKSYTRVCGTYLMKWREDKNKIICIILRHIVALDVAKLYSDNDLHSSFPDSINSIITSHRKNCSSEIEDLRSINIPSCNKNGFDILRLSLHSLTSYAKNEDIIHLLKSDVFKTKFPIYSSIIQINFRKALRRRQLIDGTYDFFKSVLQLPYVDHIISYLSCDCLEYINDLLKKSS